MTFDYLPLELRFTAIDEIRFPPGKAANVLRGALGHATAAAGLFRPPARTGLPSGLADPPRPFVLRARPLDGRTFAPGEPFGFRVHLFDLRENVQRDLEAAFAAIARAGIGAGRGRAALECVDEPAGPVRLALEPEPSGISRTRIEFLSPTELKPAGEPEFAIVYARARDRVSSLGALYGKGPLEIDFRAAGERARQVRMVRADLREVAIERRSSRTGQVHGIGGFTGAADYEGALAEFLPVLRAAEATGVGRHTVWGNGEIRVSPDAG
jgi:hypothetical protein